MDIPAIETLSGLGIGVVAIWVLYLVFKAYTKAIDKRDEAFTDYVKENNHKSIEVMTECRDAIRQSANHMKLSNELQSKMIDKITEIKK